MSKLTTSRFDLELESRLSRCIHRLMPLLPNLPDVLQSKLEKLLAQWKSIPSTLDAGVSMCDLYERHLLPNENIANIKIVTEYGLGEEALDKVYLERFDVGHREIGGYEFERDAHANEVLEMFFRIGFDHTENWECLAHTVNGDVPVTMEFYDTIRDKNLLADNEVKAYLIQNTHE
jgi:hypothetical protein